MLRNQGIFRVAFMACLMATDLLPAQTFRDPSIGRNLPGGQPMRAPDEFAEAQAPEVSKPPTLPVIQTIGRPGRSHLNGVLFSSTPESVQGGQPQSVPVGVTTEGIALLEISKAFQEKLAKEYLGQPFTEELVQQLSQETMSWYFKRNRPVVFIQPLVANFSTGTLEILVIEAVLGEKSGEGARWFSNQQLASQIRIQPGQHIDRRKLVNDLTWINENPFLRSDAIFAPGTVPGTTNIILETQDRFPLRVYAGIENTGSEQTGAWRWLAGANWGNAFYLGHQFNYQFSAAFEDISSQPVHAFSYIVPLPWRHKLAVYYTLAFSNIDIAGDLGVDDFSFEGYSSQLSPRYTIPIGNLAGSVLQEVVLGMDWKLSDLGFLQGDIEIPTNETAVWQFMAGYNIGVTDSFGRTTFGFEVFWSPGGIGPRNTDEEFQLVDPRLTANYLYSLLRLGRTTRLPWDFSLITQASGQVASGALLSSEQLAIGGYGTVRGYQERVLFGDQGVVINAELRTPPISPMGLFGIERISDELQFLAFWDFGLVSSRDPLPGEEDVYYITSVGVGVRYAIGANLSVRCDVGFPLVNPNLGFDVAPRASVGVVVGF